MSDAATPSGSWGGIAAASRTTTPSQTDRGPSGARGAGSIGDGGDGPTVRGIARQCGVQRP